MSPPRAPRLPGTLLAERFLETPDGRCLDLATAHEVWWRSSEAGNRDDQLHIEARCAAALLDTSLRRARLVDYGVCGDAWFEAWVWRGREAPRDWERQRIECLDAARRVAPSECAVGAIADDLRAFDELLGAAPGSGLRRIDLPCLREAAGPALLSRARLARLRGYVPLCLEAVVRCPPLALLLDQAHVLVFAGLRGSPQAMRDALVRVAVRAATAVVRPHVIVRWPGHSAARSWYGVWPSSLPSPALGDWKARPGPTFVAHEGAGAYTAPPGHSTAGARLEPGRLGLDGLSSGADVQAARIDQRLRGAHSDARRGRHAPAVQAFRDAIGCAARRSLWAVSAAGAVSLAWLLRTRGETAAATRACEDALGWAQRASHQATALQALLALAHVRIDDGRLAEAEAACRAAALVAEEIADPVAEADAWAALARCAFWQGRFDEPDALARRVDATHLHARGALLRYRARVAVLRGDARRAMRLAREAQALAAGEGDDRAAARAIAALAHVHAQIGDLQGAQSLVREGLIMARQRHEPLQAARLRLIGIDGLERAGEAAAAVRACRRFTARRLAALPPLLRALAEHTLDRVAGGTRAQRARPDPFVQRSGAYALLRRPVETSEMDFVHEIIAMLQTCQETDDDERALGRLCGVVRERLGASVVSVFEAAAGATLLASTNGRGVRAPDVVERALATGLLVPATSADCTIDAAAPVRMGNTTIAALSCRWPIDALVEPGRAGAILSAAAAACVPAVRGLLDRRALAPPVSLTDPPILGESPPMQVVRRAIAQASAAPFPVLIAGESGSGKELVARAVHKQSTRRDRRFCAVNCAAFADELIEAELFGHARGSFTGALSERAGLFEEAHGGTLFLDEVGELSPRAQAKLLRVLQDGEIRRIGENHSRHVDVRVVAATNRSLDDEAAAGRFRRDLLYRLDVVRIHVPALRERADDVPGLALHFWQQATARTGGRAALDRATVAALARYDWPGNVRELQNVMSALAVRAPRRGRVGPDQLPAVIAGAAAADATTLNEARRTFERRFVRAALARAGGHHGRAASDLGLTRQGLAKLIRRLDIAEPDVGA